MYTEFVFPYLHKRAVHQWAILDVKLQSDWSLVQIQPGPVLSITTHTAPCCLAQMRQPSPMHNFEMGPRRHHFISDSLMATIWMPDQYSHAMCISIHKCTLSYLSRSHDRKLCNTGPRATQVQANSTDVKGAHYLHQKRYLKFFPYEPTSGAHLLSLCGHLRRNIYGGDASESFEIMPIQTPKS